MNGIMPSGVIAAGKSSALNGGFVRWEKPLELNDGFVNFARQSHAGCARAIPIALGSSAH